MNVWRRFCVDVSCVGTSSAQLACERVCHYCGAPALMRAIEMPDEQYLTWMKPFQRKRQSDKAFLKEMQAEENSAAMDWKDGQDGL